MSKLKKNRPSQASNKKEPESLDPAALRALAMGKFDSVIVCESIFDILLNKVEHIREEKELKKKIFPYAI